MSFNPTDVNYQNYLTVRNRFDGNFAAEFDNAFIEYLCAQASATGTINTAMISTALTLALSTALRRSLTF